MTKTITQKIRAKVLWDAGFRSASSMWRFGKIPKRSAERYINEFREGGDHNRKPYSPRTQPQKAPHKIRKVITKAQNRRRIYSLRQIGASSGLSHETARSILKERKFKYARFQKRIIIDDDTRQSRLNFARKMLQKESDIPFIIFSDECSFWLNHCRSSRVWTQDPMEEEGTQPHGPKVHVWGAITSRGAVSIKIFEENLNAVGYKKILQSKTQEMHNLFPEGFIFQQDGSSVHRADICEKYINHNMPQALTFPNWPPYSPDLNPIENVWSWLKNQVNKEMPKNVNALKSCIRKHWRTLDEGFLAPYFDSMTERLEMVIENEGGRINY